MSILLASCVRDVDARYAVLSVDALRTAVYRGFDHFESFRFFDSPAPARGRGRPSLEFDLKRCRAFTLFGDYRLHAITPFVFEFFFWGNFKCDLC